jgi:hypothetical protein
VAEPMNDFHDPSDAHNGKEFEVKIGLAFTFLKSLHFLKNKSSYIYLCLTSIGNIVRESFFSFDIKR